MSQIVYIAAFDSFTSIQAEELKNMLDKTVVEFSRKNNVETVGSVFLRGDEAIHKATIVEAASEFNTLF